MLWRANNGWGRCFCEDTALEKCSTYIAEFRSLKINHVYASNIILLQIYKIQLGLYDI